MGKRLVVYPYVFYVAQTYIRVSHTLYAKLRYNGNVRHLLLNHEFGSRVRHIVEWPRKRKRVLCVGERLQAAFSLL